MTTSKRPDHNRKAPPRGLAEGIAAMLEGFGKPPREGRQVGSALAASAKGLRERSARLAAEYPDHYAWRNAEALADQCDQIANGMEGVAEGRGDEHDLLVAAADLVNGALALARTLSEVAGSYRDAPGERREGPSAEELRTATGKTALGLFNAAMRLGSAVGFPGTEPTAFLWPRPRGCGCCPLPVLPPQLPEEPMTESPFDLPEIDEEAFEESLERLLRALIALYVLMQLFARFHGLLLAYFDEYWYTACSDDCTGPKGSIIAIRMTASYSTSDGTSTPMCDGDVDLCCSSVCMGFWTEWDVVTKPVTGIKVGKGFGTGREAQAAAFAATAGAAFRAAVRAAPPVC